jgi:hypothetical protein
MSEVSPRIVGAEVADALVLRLLLVLAAKQTGTEATALAAWRADLENQVAKFGLPGSDAAEAAVLAEVAEATKDRLAEIFARIT